MLYYDTVELGDQTKKVTARMVQGLVQDPEIWSIDYDRILERKWSPESKGSAMEAKSGCVTYTLMTVAAQ